MIVLTSMFVGCTGGTGPDPSLESLFVTQLDHTYFPMVPGSLRIYEGHADGKSRRDEVRVLDEPRIIAGVGCTAIHQEVFLDGELAEVTTEWFAQDGEGNIWRFGEETYDVVDGELLPSPDSWVADEHGATAWLFLPASPQVGEIYFGYRPDSQDTYIVVSLSESAEVPAGQYEECMEVEENPDDPDDADIILYAPGTGMVSEESQDGRIELTEAR
jgi:hypothetical protein